MAYFSEDFAETLGLLGHGRALWFGEEPVQLGDVGFLAAGSFHRIFNTVHPAGVQNDCGTPQSSRAHVPNNFEPFRYDETADVQQTKVSECECIVNVDPGRQLRDEVEHFDPSCPSLEPHSPTTVLLPFIELLHYIDGVLKSLSLHTSARNDFITYWLPALSKTPYVALRFVPQAAYERAAELEVTPTPDVVTRVFMLFRGVSAEDTKSATWVAARDRAGHVDQWPSIVGVKVEAWDKSRFRVLEWGAMEVL
ncbi:hypothetical protein K466DRAFT_666900 [Polyporus arcularius HHB13444]|uniref:Uncharacterized protein n=1 Tax=Polyporus arcularius HHB13444 TaxID=1314778 RepID=A0A5C3NZK1_9APHY|nr:hypothetical protein K466DRAFT_666900 [Polyporus arcularius HHB13444]